MAENNQIAGNSRMWPEAMRDESHGGVQSLSLSLILFLCACAMMGNFTHAFGYLIKFIHTHIEYVVRTHPYLKSKMSRT